MKSTNLNGIDLKEVSEAILVIMELRQDVQDINQKLDYVIELYGELRHQREMESQEDL